MQKLGKNISQEEIDEAIKAHDIKNDGRIHFDEFKHMFLADAQI